MTEREFLSKRHFVRDEIIPGFNDKCRVIPSSGDDGREALQRSYSAKLARLMLEHAADVARSRQSVRRAARDSVSAPVHDPVRRLDRAIADLERRIPDAPNAGPTVNQMMQQHNRDYAARQARICAEAEAAYAVRNPHTKEYAR